MYIGNLELTKKQIIGLGVLALLILAIPIGVFLSQNKQIFQSKASSVPILDALEIKDADGNIINCDTTTNPPICTTNTQDIQVRVKDLDALIPK